MATRNKGELCHLHWTDHESLLRGVCNNLLTTEKFADVTLFCDGVGIKCHKFILSACSPYFDQIFSESPCSHPIIILRDVSYWQMQALLHFIYKGELNTDEAKLASLVELAQSLQIKGIGEFRTTSDEVNTHTAEEREKERSLVSNQVTKNVKDYLAVEDHTDTLSDRLNALPKESSELLENSLSVQLDASDFSLQETEVEYNFESDPLGDSQHMTSAMHEPILEYPEETSTDPAPQKKRCLRSNYATDSDADATSDISVPVTVTPVYKRYTDAQLSSAIKAVVEEGMKQVDACIKYGIPFTTLTRKLSIYRAGGGCLLPATSKKKKRSRSSNVSVASVLSMETDLESTANIENASTNDERVVLVIEDPFDVLPTEVDSKNVPSLKHYKTYPENNLKAAINAVLQNGMRMQEASKHYKIPMSTLSRKIRSHKPNDQQHLQTAMSFDVHSN
uniref:Bric-a-brac-like protein n=1 Tax=Daphnia magna TaxID=35525 RepID=A0A0P5LCB0_9CRUS